jgi:hypothetical protein
MANLRLQNFGVSEQINKKNRKKKRIKTADDLRMGSTCMSSTALTLNRGGKKRALRLLAAFF